MTIRPVGTALASVGVVLALAGTSVISPLRAADESKTKEYVTTLASDRLEGRLAGADGERLAADYIVSELQRIGAKPLPGRQDYRLPFDFTAGTRDGGTKVSLSLGNPAENGGASGSAGGAASGSVVGATARALSFSDNGDVSGSVVFAGYGIVVPESQGLPYNSYAALDVTDKVVLVLRYFPEDAEQKTKGILARYSDLRYKAMAARQRGAKALLVVTGPRSPNAGELVPMTFDTAIAGSGIVAASITGQDGELMLRRVEGKTLADAQKALDSGDPHVAGFELPGITAQIHAAVEREKRTGHNVLAYLPATTPTAGVDKPWIALGAHYDHLGHGENGHSLADKSEAGQTHHGADDNASGSAAVLSTGAILSKEARHRNVLLDFWSGEEMGLIGSAAFVAAPPVPLNQIEAYLNFDMVGRMQDNKLTVQAAGTSPAWAAIIERANVAAGFDLLVQEDPYQPTDVASFNEAGIPSLNMFTGIHTDYHRPSDTADKIDYVDLDRVVAFAAAITRRVSGLDQPPAFAKVEQKVLTSASRDGLRVFTGTIPDYSTEAKGLLLSGVVGGGPAEQAGLQKGDVIVEIAGQTISNIYDYTYALDVLKIGEATKVVYTRGGQRRETMLTPGARK